MLLMTEDSAFDRAVADAAGRLRDFPDCGARDPEAWE